jgi:serine protease Do
MNESGKVNKIITTAIVVSFIFGFGGGVLGNLFTTHLFIQDTTLIKPIVNTADTSMSDELSTISAVKNVMPSVVDIVITKDIAEFSNQTGPNILPFEDFFDYPFNFEPDPNATQEDTPLRRRVVGGGSGFIISADGLIVTNKHVIDDSSAQFLVVLNDGQEFEAQILGSDPFNDLAILKIDAGDLQPVRFGDSDAVTIGQSVIAIGNSLGEFQNTVTKGVISGINRRVITGYGISNELIEEAIQTDAAINPGNSGGPLINLKGEVIGVNTAISRSGQLIGFAIPINTAKQITVSVLEFGRIVRPWLGVRYMINTPALAKANEYTVEYGAVLLPGMTDADPAVIPESPADRAGITEEDILLTVNGEQINLEQPLGKLIAKYKPGETVTLSILRGAEEFELTVTLDEFEN